MSLNGKFALITGSSRGIGRGIALKLAQHGVKVAIHYYKHEEAAHDTLAKVREHGADGFILQGDVTRPEDIRRMFDRAQSEFGTLDIFVNNARPDLPAFYRPPLDITLDQWHTIAAILGRDPDWQALPATTPAKVVDLLRRCLQKGGPDPCGLASVLGDHSWAIDVADVQARFCEPTRSALLARSSRG